MGDNDQTQAQPSPHDPEPTLYVRIGGEPTLVRLIDNFYTRIMSDPDLSPFFRNTSMEKLRRMQHEFIGAALDGPQTYTGMALAHVHAGRGITVHHFNRFTQHLLETLRDIGVKEGDIQDVISRINTHVDDIVGGTTVSD